MIRLSDFGSIFRLDGMDEVLINGDWDDELGKESCHYYKDATNDAHTLSGDLHDLASTIDSALSQSEPLTHENVPSLPSGISF